MDIKVLTNGVFGSNTYIVSSNNQCVIIDCGNKPKDIMDVIESKKLNAKYIILSHGHADHIFYANQIKEQTSATLCIHEDELDLYMNPDVNGFKNYGFSDDWTIPRPDKLLKDGDEIQLGNETIRIIHTPGHSPGGICILIADSLFTGDTLFQANVGRTDLYGGSWSTLTDSIKNKIYTLNNNVKVYPGHGMDSTIEFERENNPYVSR